MLFWKDNWNTDIFQNRYPRAFYFAKDPDISVRHLLSSEKLGDVFFLPLSLKAKNEVVDLQSETLEISLTNDKDVWSCVWGDGDFRSAKYYAHCFSQIQVDVIFGSIWKTKCTMQWKVFLWLLLSDRLNTRNMLRRRHFRIQDDDYTCLLCNHPLEEDIVHLFFTCPFS